MKYVLSVPSKTFLLGEYAVLKGLPALLLNTEPRFELHVSYAANPGLSHDGIESLSPGGRFIQDHADFFKRYQLYFYDPHEQRGGFGASSAQFLLLYSLLTYGHATVELQPAQFFMQDLLACYQNYSWDGRGLAPSGADVIGQLQGKLTWFDKQQFTAHSQDWPFAELRAVLIRTGNKLATHRHLAELSSIPYQSFDKILLQAHHALQTADADGFIQAVKLYALELEQAGFVASATAALLAKLQALPYLLAAKGCGAMGADVILAIVAQSDCTKFCHWLTSQPLDYFVASQSPGLGAVL
jgi:mevalonate kinase